MIKKTSWLFTIAILIFTTSSLLAQSSNPEVGSKVLLYSTETKVYSFEKVLDVSNANKKELYDRIKNWVVTTLKTNKDNVYFDDATNNSISATVALNIKDISTNATSQYVEFKLIISFKDNKLKYEAHSFIYHGLDGTGVVWQKPIEELKPIRKKFQVMVYEDLDLKFDALIKSLEKAANNESASDW